MRSHDYRTPMYLAGRCRYSGRLIARLGVLVLAAGWVAAQNNGVSDAWLSRVTEDLRQSEYHFALQPDGSLGAPNRAQNLRSRFSEEGLVIVPRTGSDEEPAWMLGLKLVGYGRDGSLEEPDTLLPMADENKAVFRRDHLTEWYVNDERGIEQGFDLPYPPDEKSTELPVVIEMAIQGDVLAFPSEDGREVVFKTSSGAAVLRYAELRVVDAVGDDVEARLAVGAGRVQIRINDRDARYPLRVDPLMTSPAWTAESDQASAIFGFSVATAGDVNGDGYSDVIVGAYLYNNGQTDEGRVFVYHGSATGLQTTASWTAEGDQVSAVFGASVATAGDVNGDGYSDVIVGAYAYDNGQNDEGRAFVYHGSPSGLETTAAWTAESDQAGAEFGISVATAGDVNGDGYSDVIVGAYLYDNGQTDEGHAFVYHGSASGLQTAASWTAESDQGSAQFGISVATAGDVNGDGYSDVIVGANGYDNGQSNEGRAFVYHGSASGLQTAAAWTAEGDQTDALFGVSVSTAGDVNGDGYSDVIVGADGYDNGQTDEGRTFVYHGSASGLQAAASWTAESNQASAQFGISVSIAGDVNGDGYSDVIVGANVYDNGEMDEGRAYLYLGAATGLAINAGWTTESDQAGAQFGISVATAGDVNGDGYSDVIAGAYAYDNGETDEGRAYLYLGSASGLATSAGWTADSEPADTNFGNSVATAGDVNGDGYSDVIVGAPYNDNGQTDEGRAYVYLGSASGLSTTPAWTAESDQASALFGWSVATAGDVNGDGYSDVIVGAHLYDNPQGDEGRAYVFLGSASGLGPIAAWTAESDLAGAEFGRSVATAGDVNGDGYSDVIIGGYLYDNGEQDEGRAFVWLGSASGLGPNGIPSNVSWTAESDLALAQFGYSVATAGDVNRDGYSDVIVGAPEYLNGSQRGHVYVYLGSASGLATSPVWTASSVDNVGLGYSVATAGDVNGDGYSDVIVGEPSYGNPMFAEGRALVWLGGVSGLGADGTPSNADWVSEESNQSQAHFGWSVATAGDVNGDGYADVIVGAPHYDNPDTDEGRAYVYLGSGSGLATSAAWTAESDQDSAYFAWSAATAGDVNGDGSSDVILGARSYDVGGGGNGRAYLYHGNGGPGISRGLARSARQVRADGTAPIALLGKSDSESSFRLRTLGRTAAGRGRVKLEWEVKLVGNLFTGTALARQSSYVLTGFPDASGSVAPLDATVTGLATSSIHHWRARIVSNDPFFPRSPWLTVPYNGPNEADLRTPASGAPFVMVVSPPNNAEGISQAANVVVTFSEAVSSPTVTTSTFRLKDPGNNVVAATVSVSSSERQATLDPTASLAALTLYTVEVDSDVQDLAGNALSPSFTSTFRTEAAAPAGGAPLPEPTTPPPNPALARTGAAVGAAGDLNGDGIGDFLSGSPGYQVGVNAEAGGVEVYLGSTVASERASPDIIFTGASAHDRVGVAVAGNFDFNLDGHPDILIGAEQVDRTGSPTATGAGKVYLIYFDPNDTTHYPNLGNPSLSDTVDLGLVGQMGGIPGVVLTGVSVGDQAGFSVAGRGYPGDPLWPGDPAALLIGAPSRAVGANTTAGTAYLIFNNPTLSGAVSLSRVANGLGDQVAGIVYQGTAADDRLGYAVTFPGDVMGSPGNDLAFSAPYADTVVDEGPKTDGGKVYVVQGGALSTGTVAVDDIGGTIAGTQFLGDQDGALLGFSLAGGGDNRADGHPDFLMGARGYDRVTALETTTSNVGAVFQTSTQFGKGIIEVCLVGSVSTGGIEGAMYLGAAADDQLGYACAGVGDVNGDGYDDVALGAPYADPNLLTDAGTTYVVLGSATPDFGGTIDASTVGSTTAGFEFTGAQTGEHAGGSLAGTGDLNAGGTSDFVVGAPDSDVITTGDNAGTVYQVILDDLDSDGTLDGQDCAPANSQLWSTSGEVRSVVLVDRNTVNWAEPLERGGVPGTVHYDTVRSTSSSDFTSGAAVCVETDGTDTTSTDMAAPPVGGRFFYLVVARNTCGRGDPGTTSAGAPHSVRSCP